MTAPGSAPSSRALPGSLVALGGGALAIVGTWLPWLTSDREDLSGWRLFDLRSEFDENPFVVGEMFRDSLDPFFTGGVTLVFALVASGLAVAGLLLAMTSGSGRGQLNPALRFGALAGFAVVGAASFLNTVSILRAPSEVREFVSVGFGLLLVLLGSAAGATGMAIAGGGSAAPADRPAAAGSATWSGQAPVGQAAVGQAAVGQAATSPAAAGALPADWYPDGTGRHQLRYWDGTAWTANVSDGGVTGTDPV